RRRPDAAAVVAVALRALHLRVDLAAVTHAARAPWCIREGHQLARRRRRQTRVERLHVVDERPPLLVVQQVLPRRHARAARAARDRAKEILVSRQLAAGGRPELELSRGEVARRWDEERRPITIALAFGTMALNAVCVVDLSAFRNRRRAGRRARG